MSFIYDIYRKLFKNYFLCFAYYFLILIFDVFENYTFLSKTNFSFEQEPGSQHSFCSLKFYNEGNCKSM